MLRSDACLPHALQLCRRQRFGCVRVLCVCAERPPEATTQRCLLASRVLQRFEHCFTLSRALIALRLRRAALQQTRASAQARASVLQR